MSVDLSGEPPVFVVTSALIMVQFKNILKGMGRGGFVLLRIKFSV
jgi:hypothetical protein